MENKKLKYRIVHLLRALQDVSPTKSSINKVATAANLYILPENKNCG
jgi:hypothetical protein